MVMIKDEKQVNIGDMVFLDGKLGRLESIWENKVNVRITSDNELYTVDPQQVTPAGQKERDEYYKGQSRAALVDQARALKKELLEYDLWLEVKQATAEQIKAHKEEKEKAAAAANIGPSGNVVTEVKQEPLAVDTETDDPSRREQRQLEREQQKELRDTRQEVRQTERQENREERQAGIKPE